MAQHRRKSQSPTAEGQRPRSVAPDRRCPASGAAAECTTGCGARIKRISANLISRPLSVSAAGVRRPGSPGSPAFQPSDDMTSGAALGSHTASVPLGSAVGAALPVPDGQSLLQGAATSLDQGVVSQATGVIPCRRLVGAAIPLPAVWDDILVRLLVRVLLGGGRVVSPGPGCGALVEWVGRGAGLRRSEMSGAIFISYCGIRSKIVP